MKHQVKRILAFAMVLLILGSGIQGYTYAADSNQSEIVQTTSEPQTITVPGSPESAASEEASNTAAAPSASPALQEPAQEAPAVIPEVDGDDAFVPTSGDDTGAEAQLTTEKPDTEKLQYDQKTLQLAVGATEILDFGQAAQAVLEEGSWSQIALSLNEAKNSLAVTGLEAGTASFRLDVTQGEQVQYIQYTVTVTEAPKGDNEGQESSDEDVTAPTGETEDTPPQTVTVKFVIADENYTKDPGSGNTHVTVAQPFDGSELNFTEAVNAYNVTGTGALCGYTIPADTSMAGNGYTLPKLTITNIGDGNSYTYQSPYTWTTEAGQTVSQNTVFSQDTTLYLNLYQANESYSLNFVCGTDENHSITYVLGGYPSATFSPGQSVSAEYIPDADDINENYSSEWCKHGKDHGETFLKWQLKNTATGEMVDFYAGMPITQEYVKDGSVKVYAVWTSSGGETPQEYSLALHDLDFDGNSRQDIQLSVKSGQTLADVFSAAETKTLADGTALADCRWYTRDEQGGKQLIAADTTLTGDMTIYTYSYRVTLTLSPQQSLMARLMSLVEIDEDADGTLTMTITAREGQSLKASDFVVDGVDYSTYQWRTADGEIVNIPQLIANGLTENITATSTETGQTTCNINFYIAVDGKWVLLSNGNMAVYTIDDRCYLTAAQLESVYGFYGFTAGQLTEGRSLFPHTSRGDSEIWGDAVAVENGGIIYSPILKYDDIASSCDVYYMPEMQPDNSIEKTDQGYIDANSFYTLKVSDPGHKVYEGSTAGLTKYARTGTTASVTVNTAEGVTWQCVGKDGTTIQASDDAGQSTVTFTIEKINQPYTLSPVMEEDEILITYDINLPYPASDGEYTTPTVGGEEIHSILLKSGSAHTVLSPSVTQYFYESGKYLGEATFTGWEVSGTERVLQPGESYVPSNSVILTAQWDTKVGGNSGDINQSTIVNFFVSLTAIPQGGTSWNSGTTEDLFIDSVYATDCGVTGQDVIDHRLYDNKNDTDTQYYILGASSGQNLQQMHNDIVYKLTGGYTKQGNDGKTYTFKADFPTDEEALRQIRAMVNTGTQIQLNGKTVSVDDLTSDNFTIMWHVFKFDTTDSWHIDGVLVAKTGTLRVQKTFSGDEEAIEAVKGGDYAIEVKYVENGFIAPNESATLTLDDSDPFHRPQYDPATNTYTWTIDVDQYRDYTITEKNYVYNQGGYTTEVQYNVINSKYQDQNTDGWVDMPQGNVITVTGQSEGQAVQTVSLNNIYTKPGAITLRKVDAYTNTAGAGIAFTLAIVDGKSFDLYDLGGSHYAYMLDGDETGKLMQDKTIVTDSTGLAYLYLEPGAEYTLEEQNLNAYEDPGLITFTIGNDGQITGASSENEAQNRDFVQVNGTELLLRNYSEYVPLTVEKIWRDGENTQVVIQTSVNNMSMGERYRRTLSQNNSWVHTFDGTDKVPLMFGGKTADYSIREEQIGTWSYSDEYSGDGYRYYDVTYSGMQYVIAGEKYTPQQLEAQGVDLSDVDSIYLSVSNQRSTGALRLTKVDQNNDPLPGAEFWLYNAPDTVDGNVTSTQDGDGNYSLEGYGDPRTATSAQNGSIDFGSVPIGKYFLVEHAAPANYMGSGQVFLVEVQGFGNHTVKAWDDGSGAWVQHRDAFINTLQTVELTVEKHVEGNMGILSQRFDFSLVSDKTLVTGEGYQLGEGSKTATFDLADEESVTLTVPKGAQITLTETGAEGYSMTAALDQGAGLTVNNNTITYTVPNNSTDHVTIIVTNTKNMNVDTGVFLDSLPYIIILALMTVAFAVHLKSRRRSDRYSGR